MKSEDVRPYCDRVVTVEILLLLWPIDRSLVFVLAFSPRCLFSFLVIEEIVEVWLEA